MTFTAQATTVALGPYISRHLKHLKAITNILNTVGYPPGPPTPKGAPRSAQPSSPGTVPTQVATGTPGSRDACRGTRAGRALSKSKFSWFQLLVYVDPL